MITNVSRGFRGSQSLALSCASARVASPAPPLFAIQSDLWVNLHHFLRVVARGEPARATLTADEQVIWDAAVATYKAKYANRDLLRDEGMLAVIRRRSRATAAGSISSRVRLCSPPFRKWEAS
ncbi:MAG TPA: hypothetical protein VEK79_15160 [Thermoanaerobaculia bacterium]|nr:hypothetical protein [Thermoanaerobaculia bacterium]